jgi:hypothetical protein
MYVIWKDHHRVDLEGKAQLRLAHGVTKAVDILDQQAAVAVEQIDREKLRAPGNEYATIVGHAQY